MATTIMLNGQEIETREVWVCACSGGCGGKFQPRCAIKGGHDETHAYNRDGDLVAMLVEDDEDRNYLIREWAWEDMGGGWIFHPTNNAL